MKKYNTTGVYKNSTGNLIFNKHTMEAHSYKWWKFLSMVEGKLVLNSYRYSMSTSKHQRTVLGLLHELGIKPDYFLQLPKGINGSSLEELFLEAEETLCNQYLSEQLKRQERYLRAKERRLVRMAATEPIAIPNGGTVDREALAGAQ
jgi:hypothetical protein